MRTIVDALLHHARETPDRVALRTMDGTVVTWGGLADTAARVASALASSGVRTGDRVAVLAGNSLVWPFVDLGTSLARGISVGLYPTSSPEQVADVLNDCGARLLVVEDGEQLTKVQAIRARVPTLTNVVLWRGTAERATDWDSWMRAGTAAPRPLPSADDDAVLIYTSGSTGAPKGARISHACLVATAESIAGALGLTCDDTALSFLPFCHAAERMFGHATRIWVGMEAMMAGDPARVFEAASAYQPTVFGGLPRFYEKAYDAMRAAEVGAASVEDGTARAAAARVALFGARVRRATSGGAALPLGVAEYLNAHNLCVLGAYGQTEHLCVAMHRPDRCNFTSVGLPMPGTELRIAEDGEVLVRRSALTFSGYWGRADETREAFTADGIWLKTGDLGSIDGDGFLTIVGRKKELIALSSGTKVAPAPIEAALASGPWIEHAVLCGEGRHFVSALLTVRQATLRHWAAAEGLPWDPAVLLSHPGVLSIVQQHVDAVNATLSRPERVKRWVIAPRSLSADAGDLTPTLKVKRREVTARYAALLAPLYE